MAEFLQDAWYAAAWDHEVGRAPLARTILDCPVVLYRDLSGRVVALEDRCCHRGLPLSRGRVSNDDIECGYHGLVFNPAGQCVRVPGQARVPPGSSVKAWPVLEKYRFVWLWMGNPEHVDESLLPDWQVMDHPDWRPVKGDPPFHVPCHYELFNDNLLDLTHIAYVHVRNIGTRAVPDFPIITTRGDDWVRMTRWIMDSAPAPLYQKFGRFTGNIDRWQITETRVPSYNTVWVGCLPAGCGAGPGDDPGSIVRGPGGRNGEGFEFFNLNAITPETGSSCWYFYAHSRNFALDDPEMDELFQRELRGAFQEDVDILTAQQANMARHEHKPKPWLDIQVDGPGLLMRRMVRDAIAAEDHADRERVALS